ncbi:MAG TPA: hypothetical protein VHX44_15535 [Planctomycetota bacterium]|jgi:hypothetical protein|nr:hypothetical protein [Planctomycetota bacterium]
MRHALLILLIPLTLLLSGCCVWWDDDEEEPYHEVRVKNHTDQTVTIHYTAVVHVTWHTDEDGNHAYEYDHKDKSVDIPAGKHKDILVPREATVDIKGYYYGIEHHFTKSADSLCPCDLSITMDIDDFVPPTPAANG